MKLEDNTITIESEKDRRVLLYILNGDQTMLPTMADMEYYHETILKMIKWLRGFGLFEKHEFFYS